MAHDSLLKRQEIDGIRQQKRWWWIFHLTFTLVGVMNRLTVGIAALLVCGGCISLTTDEKQQLKAINANGFSLENPPRGFISPVDAGKAAGLNALPGIGNFYLASNEGGSTQWALGVGNLLLWPFSPIWSIYQGYADAETLNNRSLVQYCKTHNPVSLFPPTPTPIPTSTPTSTPTPTPTPTPSRPYDFETIAPYSNGTEKFLVTILDESLTNLQVDEEISPRLQKIVREHFSIENHAEENVRVFAAPVFKGREITYAVTAFLANPVTDKWSYKYSADTKRGFIRLCDRGEVYRDWAIKNIAKIVSDKNVIIAADSDTIPSGAKFRLLDEDLRDGFRTITFEAIE